MPISNLNNRNDDLIELNKSSFNNQAFNFNIPTKHSKLSSSTLGDELFNRKKISDDVISMSSRSSSRASSVSGGKMNKASYMNNAKNIYRNKDVMNAQPKKYSRDDSDSSMGSRRKKRRDEESSESGDSVASGGSDESGGSGGSDESGGSGGSDESGESGESGDSGGSDGSGDSGDSGGSGRSGSDGSGKMIKRKHLSAKDIIKNEINEKREIIYQLDRLESKGFKIPFKFNMNSDLEEMRSEFRRITREKELDGSVRFQQKMLMAFISGSEYMNTRYDPFSIKLDGWSEQVNENINDYDDIFEELHYKYKATGKQMAPELRLFISLSGSAFMFHLTSRMFKEQPMPDVENVLKSDPELMKQFQNAAAKQYMTGNVGNMGSSAMPRMTQNQNQGGGNDSMGLFSMVSNLFGSLNSDSMSMDMPSPQRSNFTQMNKGHTEDIDNIIKNVHNKISIDDSDNNIETLSVSDEEITSIIEDTADIHILKTKGRPRKGTRTLNI